MTEFVGQEDSFMQGYKAAQRFISVKERLPNMFKPDVCVSELYLVWYRRIDCPEFPDDQLVPGVAFYCVIEDRKFWSLMEPFSMDCFPEHDEDLIEVLYWRELIPCPEKQ